MPRRTLVVVGHGMVAQRLLEALGDRDATGTWEVVVLGEEPRPAYDRVALSSYVAGRPAAELCLLPDGFLDRPGLAVHLADPVTLSTGRRGR